MGGIRELIDLQEIDRQIDTRKARQSQISKEIEGSAELIAAKAELTKREAALKAAERALRDAEEEAAANQARIALIEQRMYGGQTTVSRELQGMTTEIAHLKERQGTLDQTVLQRMDAADPLRKAVKDQAAGVSALEGQWAAQRERLAAERDRLAEEQQQWESRRAKHAALVAPTSLSLYNRLRASKGNLAVVKVERGVCSGCRMTIPTTLVQKARAGKDLVYCSSCARLIFVA